MNRLLSSLILSSLSLFALDDGKKTNPQDAPPAPQLLDRARDLAGHFSDEEQLLALLEVADAFGTVDRSRVEEVALQVFYLARKNLQPGPLRASTEKNALTKLAFVNPQRAAQLYRLQELPNEDPKVSEDRRSFGARALFPKLWEVSGISALPQIESLANWLGDTGQYPYPAMAPIVRKVYLTDPAKAQELFQEAAVEFGKDPGFIGTNRQFVLFLIETRACVSSPAIRDALQQALAAIGKQSAERGVARKIQVSRNKQTQSFDSEASYLVYRMLPLIESIDPAWAKDTLEKYSSLRGIPQAALDSDVVTVGAISFDTQPASGALQSALDENRLTNLSELAQNDPQAALQSANLIADPVMRATALAALQQESAGAWESDDAQKRLDAIPNNVTKLRLLVALGCRTKPITAPFRRYASQAIEFGTELFNQDMRSNPGKLSYMGNGFEQMVSLAGCYGNEIGDMVWMNTQIEKTGNEILKAHMLAALAKASANLRPSAEMNSDLPH